METLLLKSNSKKDLTLLLNLAKEIGLDLVVAPKRTLEEAQKASNSKISKQEMIMQLSKEVNKSGTKKAFAKLGLDYDSYSR
jgi:hypothetical protein